MIDKKKVCGREKFAVGEQASGVAFATPCFCTTCT